MYRDVRPHVPIMRPLKHFSQLWLFYCILIITKYINTGTRTVNFLFLPPSNRRKDLGERKAPCPSSVPSPTLRQGRPSEECSPDHLTGQLAVATQALNKPLAGSWIPRN